jgi:phosphatidylserine/phosphatidylglycerophosphate/cardiolipin synthase-like enzyme
VAVTVVSDRTRTGARELAGTWPAGAAPLTALEGVEPEMMKWIVHGKVLVADRRMALVGSANFTEGGLLRNVEIGVRLEGRVAEEICRFVKKLETEGWLTVAKP